MGQYFRVVNVTKKQRLDPHGLGAGQKLGEICADGGPGRLLLWLLVKTDDPSGVVKSHMSGPHMGRWQGKDGKFIGGHNFTWQKKDWARTYAGSWAGDVVVAVGDYDRSGLYAESLKFKDITDGAAAEYNQWMDYGPARVGRGRELEV